MNYEITVNEQYNSTEIKFDGIPSTAIKNRLKANGFRWHKTKGVWYGRQSVEYVKGILSA